MGISRRHILAGTGMTLTSGCLGRFTEDPKIKLGSIRVANPLEETHTVDLVLERDESRVYHGTVEVGPNENVWIDPDWPSEATKYEMYYTVSGSDEIFIAQFIPRMAPDDLEEKCVFADLWTIRESGRANVSLGSIDEYEEATCNS